MLGLTGLNTDRAHDFPGVSDNQLRTFSHIGLLTNLARATGQEATIAGQPHDLTASLEQRALLSAHQLFRLPHPCRRRRLEMLLSLGTANDQMSLIGARPQHDTFGIQNAMLIPRRAGSVRCSAA